MSHVRTERFEALLEAQTASQRAEQRTALSRLSVELAARSRTSSRGSTDYFSRALKALRRIKGTAHAELRTQCLFECCSYFYTEGLQSQALDAAHCAAQIATHSGDAALMRKAHTYVAGVQADLGNISDALVHYVRALELCKQLQDEPNRIRVLINLGCALNYAGLYDEAIPCFQRCEVVSQEPSDDPQQYYRALTNHAQSLYFLGRFEEGFELAEAAAQGIRPPESPSEALSCTIKELTAVQLALEVGKVSIAKEHGKRCVEYSRTCGSTRALALADVAMGLCDVYGGSVQRGIALLEKVVRGSSPREPHWLDATSALVRAYDMAGDPASALQHVKLQLQYLRSQRKKSLSVLLSVQRSPDFSVADDLQALELREAKLEARVAEAQAIYQQSEMLERLATAADVKEEASGEHGYRVGKLSALVASSLGWSHDVARKLEIAARLHDIGKIAMPDRILLTSEKLKEAERQFISTHTTIGAELLGKSNVAELRMAEAIARHHHEWWNGEGYPSKLKGKRIPIHARIVALSDVFDALTHGRPFSPAWPVDRALEEIRARKGTQFDPELTDLFLDLIERLQKEHEDLDEYLGRAGKSSPFLQARNKIRQMLAEERENEKLATVIGNETRH